MTSADDAALVEAARQVRERAFAPVSGYRVGAAVRAEDGSVWTGCNVEHVVLPESVCAEKVALVKAVSEGRRRFDVVAVMTDGEPAASPCGSCRQMLHAWGIRRVLLCNVQGEVRAVALSDLLPLAFDLAVDRLVPGGTRGA